MTIRSLISASLIALGSVFIAPPTDACTNLLATPGAMADGSTIICYTCDGEFHPRLRYTPGAIHAEGAMEEITTWSGDVLGSIPLPSETYNVIGNMNEHQLSIAETTTEGRAELINPDGLIHYWDLIQLTLKRAKTAREAVEVMGKLVADHNYRSSGESFCIGDPNEAWIMEMFGTGPGGEGAVWVALKVPDGYISSYANKPRIDSFPLDDPANCLYSKNVITFAIEKGYYDPASGVPFSFKDAYGPDTVENRRFAAARVWSIYRRAAPSQEFSPAYHRGDPNAEPYPLWIKPDAKLTTADVFSLLRDHYEGTEYDMTQGVDAGPWGTPNRFRPLFYELDGERYGWERPISSFHTGFSFVAQSRSWLPDPIGGVFWYGVDDTYTTCYVPLYCGIDEVPPSFTAGSMAEFSWDSAWWTFNFVANFANLKYSHMIEDIQTVQFALEDQFLALQPAIEKTALELHTTNPPLMQRYLTDYSITHGELVVQRWRELAEHLITKYNDGYVRDQRNRPRDEPYPESWLRTVLNQRGDQFKLPAKLQQEPSSPEAHDREANPSY